MKGPIALLAVIAAIIFESCNLYSPTVINSPILEEKGELNLGASFGSTIDANLSYSITNHIAVLGAIGSSGSITIENDSTNIQPYNIDHFKNYKFEGAAGYYTTFKDKFLYNVFIGYAQGKSGALVSDYYSNNNILILNGAYGANFSSLFLQTAIQANLSDDTYFGITGRINNINLSNIEYSFDPTVDGRYVTNENMFLVAQIALDFNIKWDKFGAFSQMQFAFHDGYNEFFTVRRLGLHAGFYLRLDKIFK